MLLQAKNLTKTYPEGIVALQDFNCGLDKGFTGVIGPNSAGKTTLLKLIAGVEQPTAGNICFDGQELTQIKPPLFSMGYLPQEFGFYNALSGEDMLEYIAVLKGIRDKQMRRYIVDEAITMVNLNFARKQAIGEYSFGMKKRLGIAQALIGKPRLLVLDEPMEGLDPEESMSLVGLISNIAADRLVIVATHSLCDVDNCKTIIVLRCGKNLYQGTPEKLAGFADGLVWQVETNYQQLEQIKMMFKVVGVQQKGDFLSLRILAKHKPFGWKAIAAKASPKEGYLALMTARINL